MALQDLNFETLHVRLDGALARIELHRPDKANAINAKMWRELREAMHWLDRTDEARVGIISGAGRFFTAGIDLEMLDDLRRFTREECRGRAGEKLRLSILELQDTITAVERCRKPVIASVHAACIGGGIDLISACDLRYCSEQAWFSVKEVDVGLVADVGTLQRLPKLVGEGMARELSYTARRVDGCEAEQIRLVNRCYADKDALDRAVDDIARDIAAKSPLAIRGTKEMITYVRDHPVADGLNYIATWNAAMLLSNDLDEALAAVKERRVAVFRD
ncbi:crotonase/enoyl-CoA hydratase family protein [Noviherbaspirillum saxi]|uniref:Crotonase/enoyl-CoA hydratase family protein n=1 Tax=Noviherbaspirillum saxi TaxID=2320863 RepID=A0A3A3FIW3_9BURK|nr:crotonase/enoyl-CoA hydratase family protein [Noviherbaspirillum saxi]RJF95428.1 crotonase/enoyl-CoA hydratase family protein [Noviherbaspirillum saxi]